MDLDQLNKGVRGNTPLLKMMRMLGLTERDALAEKLANGPTLAYATMKKNIATAMDGTITEVLLAEAEGQRLAGAGKDAMEGGMAFLQKRKPDFKGE